MADTRAKYVSTIALLGSLAVIFEVLPLDVPYPLFPRITYDPAGIPATLATMLYGISAGVLVQLMGCFGILTHGDWLGSLAKGCAEISTIVPLYIVIRYCNIRTLGGKLCLLTIPPASRAIAMSFFNYYITTLLLGIPKSLMYNLLLPIAVFNVTQAWINIIVSYAVYNRIKED